MRQVSAYSALVLLLVLSKAFAQELPAPPNSWELRVASDISLQGYNLEGDAFKATDAGSSGTGQSVDVLWKRTGYNLHVNYKNFSHELSTPTGLSPNKVTANWARGLLSYETEFNNQVIFQIGLDHRSRASTETTPNHFMPIRSHTGVRVGAIINHSLSPIFRFEFGGGLMVPFIFSETTPSTGNLRFGANPDLNIDFIYKVNHFIDFSVGAHWMMEFTSFAGTGSRGTLNATETFNNFILPIELRFQF